MVIDPICALVFEAEPEAGDLMERPPRPPRQRLFSRALVLRGIGHGLTALATVAAVYLVAYRFGLSPGELRTLSFLTLVGGILALVFAQRSTGGPLRRTLLQSNRAFRWVLAVVGVGSALILSVPSVQRVLKFAPLGPVEVAIAAAAGGSLLVILVFAGRLRPPRRS
jgi:Ca2+-transporting ATPase